MLDNTDSRPDNFLDHNEGDDPFAPLPGPDGLTPRRGGDGGDGDDGEPYTAPGGTPRRAWRRWLIAAAAIVVIALFVAVWLRYFNPVVTDSVERGYIRNVERRGLLFKTFEGDMTTENAIADTTHLYQRDFLFSITDDSLARVVQSYQGTGRPVLVTYKRYSATLPWRGSSKTVVTDIQPLRR